MTIQMIYASTSGNTQLVIKYLEHFLSSGSIEVQVTEVSQLEVTGLSGDIWIFACGTYGHGLLQKDMKHLLEDGWSGMDLDSKRCAVIGLGDRKYDQQYHIESASVLEKWILDHGGEVICEPLKINGNPLGKLQSLVDPWGEQFIQKIQPGNES